MRIENVNKENYVNVLKNNENGKKFTYLNESVYAYKDEERIFTIPNEILQEVLNEINLNLMNLNIPIFIIPDQLMQFDEKYNMYIGEYFQGRAYPTHIVLGGREIKPTKENIGCLAIHEIGHILMYKALNCSWDTSDKVLREYKKLRGIPDKWTNKKNGNWYTRPAEVFAEDFRFLFGSDYMLIDPYDEESDFKRMYYKIGEPKQEIKDYMIKLLESLKSE